MQFSTARHVCMQGRPHSEYSVPLGQTRVSSVQGCVGVQRRCSIPGPAHFPNDSDPIHSLCLLITPPTLPQVILHLDQSDHSAHLAIVNWSHDFSLQTSV